ncbi:hypothetical protein OPIT5_22480 [Opitutaceae bacterium TAV5]|nr:hypothetical protein OPIT5_22480 [Opitutaceae bacterium TAV5]
MTPARQKLLIVTRHTPLPWEDGAGAYLHDLARYLATDGFRVHILWLAPHDRLRWKKIWRLPAPFARAVRLHLPGALRLGRRFVFLAVVWLPFKARALDRVRRALNTVGLAPPRRHPSPAPPAAAPLWASPPTPAELALVVRFFEKHRPDVVITNYAWLCPILDLPALRRTCTACLTHDIGWQRAALSAPGIAPEITRDGEAAWLRRAALLVAISETDAAELAALAPAARVVVAPKACETRAPFAETTSRSLLFVGSDNAFNARGLDWFLREVWPRLLREVPDVSLHVCGSIDRLVTLCPDGVAFHGPVPDLAPCYRQAALVIVPLLQSTGLNIKLVEAAACGRAIVTTPAALPGAPFLRDAVAVAATPGEFAAAIRHLLDQPAVRAATAARALAAVRARLAPATCYGPLAALLRANAVARHDVARDLRVLHASGAHPPQP